MSECRLRTGRDAAADDFRDAGTITRLRVESFRRAAMTDSAREPAAPSDVFASSATERYPVGLREELCKLSS